jgi:cell division protein FtsL
MGEGGVKGSGAIRLSAAFALLFASLTLVVFRQSRALEELRALDALRASRAVLQAERSSLQREIQRLESRSRILAVAWQRLRLRVPDVTETVYLHEPIEDGRTVPERVVHGGLVTAVER